MKIEKINNLFRQLANWILRHRLVVGALFAVVIGFSLVGAHRQGEICRTVARCRRNALSKL